MQNKGKNTTI